MEERLRSAGRGRQATSGASTNRAATSTATTLSTTLSTRLAAVTWYLRVLVTMLPPLDVTCSSLRVTLPSKTDLTP
eukprot:183620-Rhodomonas_salina.3